MTDAEKIRRAVEDDTYVGDVGSPGQILAAEVRRLSSERDAFREAYRRSMVAYLRIGHDIPGDKALAEADRRVQEVSAGLRAE